MNISNYKTFMKNNNFCVSYTYSTNPEYYLAKSDNNIKKSDINIFNCKSINWFHSVKSKEFLDYIKKKFKDYIKNNSFKISNQNNFINRLICNNKIKKNTPILGTSDVLYPFVKKNFKTLAIPNNLHSERINRYYIYCMIYQMIIVKQDIYLCLPIKKTLGKINNKYKSGFIRYTTKEIYTIYEILKSYHMDQDLKGRTIMVKKLNNSLKLFNVWKLYVV